MHRTIGPMALLLLFLPVHAWAYHVAPTGSDSADGSAQHPWATIEHAAKVAKAGDTVHVAPGEYRGAVTTRASGTTTARVRFVSDTRWGAKIRAHRAGACWDNYGDYVDIEGFDISGDGWIGIENWGSCVRMMGNHVHDIPARGRGDNGGAGIANGNSKAHDSDIIGNVVHGIGDPDEASRLVHGIYLANSGGLIANNVVYRCQGLGIHCWHAADRATIANNLVFENRTGGIVVGAGGSPGGVVADHFLVTNNIAIYNKRYGISEYGEVGAHNRYLHNLVFGNARGGLHLLHGNLEEGTVAADPKLANYRPDGAGDYHLAAGSPAIDAGTPHGAPPTDLDGIARPQGTAVDIGPYERRQGGQGRWRAGEDAASQRLPGQAQRFAAEVAAQHGLSVTLAAEPRKAVSGPGLVVTAGDDRYRHCTIKPGWLDEGDFASLVDMDVYWEDAALQEVDKFVTDDLGQFEAYRSRGSHFQGTPPLYATLGEIVAGRKPGRTQVGERTMACNTGAAVGDMAAAMLVREHAIVRGVGAWLPLWSLAKESSVDVPTREDGRTAGRAWHPMGRGC